MVDTHLLHQWLLSLYIFIPFPVNAIKIQNAFISCIWIALWANAQMFVCLRCCRIINYKFWIKSTIKRERIAFNVQLNRCTHHKTICCDCTYSHIKAINAYKLTFYQLFSDWIGLRPRTMYNVGIQLTGSYILSILFLRGNSYHTITRIAFLIAGDNDW